MIAAVPENPTTADPPERSAQAPDPREALERYERALEGRDAPVALVDLDALWANAGDMLARAQGKPIRVASKSVRCRPLLRSMLDRDAGFRGLMTFTLDESLWLAAEGFEDLLLAYPTADRGALERLGRLDEGQGPVLMVDSARQLDLIEQAAGREGPPLRLCIELDLAYRLMRGRLKIGPKRSPIRTPAEAVALAREIERRPRLRLVGLMGYEGHVAGLGDEPRGKPLRAAGIKRMQAASMREIAERRGEVVAAVSKVTPLELVNGGGTGSLERTAAEPAVTELTAGSGFYAPTLFDRYSTFTLHPAAIFALPVVRRPSGGTATVLGGGYLASGPADGDRLPEPYLPAGLKLDAFEGAGEVQTPVSGEAAAKLEPGDRVYFRHAKAGELCERFNSLLLISGGEVVDEVPTYRGEGKCFL